MLDEIRALFEDGSRKDALELLDDYIKAAPQDLEAQLLKVQLSLELKRNAQYVSETLQQLAISYPDEDQIRKGISGNLCRCTGYAKIVDAVKTASGSRDEVPAMPDTSVVGKSQFRPEAYDKVTGGREYPVNVKLAGMLHSPPSS